MSRSASVLPRVSVLIGLRSGTYAAALGGLAGAGVIALLSIAPLPTWSAGVPGWIEFLNQRVGPVWMAMLAVALRVAWLNGRALQSRNGSHPGVRPVRPELQQLAPVFAALGLCGTVWGLAGAFASLDTSEFMSRLPRLLAGLGAAMTSTLVGLSLQIGTLLLAAYNPCWSRAVVRMQSGEKVFALDGVALGSGEEGRARLLDSLRARAPEALRLVLDRGLPQRVRDGLAADLWEQLSAGVPLKTERL